MTALFKKLAAKLKSLFARKLLIAFIVGFVAALADGLTSWSQSGQPFSTSLIEAMIVGALATAARGLLALLPINIVPSDAMHTARTRAKPPRKRVAR